MSATRAANPDTPAEQLAQLAARFPAEVLGNPVLPLLLLEQPDWLAQLPEAALLACLNEPNTPPTVTVRPALLLAAAAHPAPLVRLAAAGQPDLPAELLAQLGRDPNPHVQNLAHYRHEPLPAAADLPAAVAATLNLPLAAPLTQRLQETLEILAKLPAGLAPAALPLLRTALGDREFMAVLAARADLTAAQVLALAVPLVTAGDYVPDELLARLLPGQGSAPATPTFSAVELAALAASPDELARHVAAAHPATPVAARRGLLRPETSIPVLSAVGRNPAWTAAELRELLPELETAPYGEAVWGGMGHNPNTPPDVLLPALLAPESTPLPFLSDWALAGCPHLTPLQLAEVLTWGSRESVYYLFSDGWREVLKRVARNPAAPPALQAWLLLHFPSDFNSARWQEYVALGEWLPETAPHFERVLGQMFFWCLPRLPPPAELLALLLASPLVPAGLKALLAATPLAWLPPVICSVHHADGLRTALASNPAAAPAVLAALADDPSLDVRQALARNPATPPAVLRRLATDRTLRVARIAVRHPAYPAPTATNDTADEATAVFEAANPTTPPARLAHLAHHQRSAVRMLVAEHLATPPEVLTQLAQDKIIGVRAAVAAHPAVPLAALETLAADPADIMVRRQAILNPRLPAAAVPARLQDKSLYNRLLLLHQPAGRLALLQAAADKTPAVRRLLQLAAPEYLTAAHRAALAASPYPAERLSVAHLPEFQAQLQHDPHLLVRTVAGVTGG